MSETWWAYECLGCGRRNDSSGVVLDMRTDDAVVDPNGEAPQVKCPMCGAPMLHKGLWPADEGGFGRLLWISESMAHPDEESPCYDCPLRAAVEQTAERLGNG